MGRQKGCIPWNKGLRSTDIHTRKKSTRRNIKKYGITDIEYVKMLNTQKNICAICGKPETKMQGGKIQGLSIDHDHNTGKVRGLLCCKCNHLIGFAYENIELLKRCINYLNKDKVCKKGYKWVKEYAVGEPTA